VVIQATTHDGHVAAEFWVDTGSSLLVRRETFDTGDRAYSDVRYTSLTVDAADPDLRTVKKTMPLAPTGTTDPTVDLARLRARGWWAGAQLPGNLSLYDAREVPSSTGPVLHLSYSDGISTVSVFEQRGRLAGTSAALPAGWRNVAMPDGRRVVQAAGTPVRAAWQAHDLVLAVIADVPTGQVMPVIQALPAGPAPSAHRGVTGRIGRGLSRMGSLLNPFG
jgi:sigma-E factor negative regulatory protein RseB